MSDFDRRLAELAGVAGGAARLEPASVLRKRGQRRTVRRRAVGGVTLMALLVFAPAAVVTSCLGGPNPQPQPADTASSPTPAQQSPTPAQTPKVNAITACAHDQLGVTISDAGRGEGGAGHSSTALLLRNNSSQACTLNGYPKVVALNASGGTVAEAQQTPNGYMGGLMSGQPPTITLQPGQEASALFETLNANPDGTSCKTFASLRITPPGGADTVTIPWGFGGCAEPQIHPIVAGNTGRA